MSEKPIYLKQGEAFNIWSALGERAYKNEDPNVRDTFLKLEEKFRQHLNTAYPKSIDSKELRREP